MKLGKIKINVNQNSDKSIKRYQLKEIIDDLDSGKVRVAEKIKVVNGLLINILKKLYMLSFRIS